VYKRQLYDNPNGTLTSSWSLLIFENEVFKESINITSPFYSFVPNYFSSDQIIAV